jgi:lysophospholipase I
MGGDPDSLRKHEDQEGILRTQKHVHELIQQEIDSGIPADRIVLGGFSQGGAVGIFAGLTAKVKLAGIVALSAYLVLSQQFAALVPKPEFNKDTPIFMGHGDSDQVVHTQLGQLSQSMLNVQGYNVTFKVYEDLEHSATPEELDDVEEFLNKVLPPKGGKAEGKAEL